jgi:hypothetical protein
MHLAAHVGNLLACFVLGHKNTCPYVYVGQIVLPAEFVQEQAGGMVIRAAKEDIHCFELLDGLRSKDTTLERFDLRPRPDLFDRPFSNGNFR